MICGDLIAELLEREGWVRTQNGGWNHPETGYWFDSTLDAIKAMIVDYTTES